MQDTISQRRALVYVALSALLFATGGLLIKLCTWGPITINGMRGLFAGISMYTMLKCQGYRFVWNKKVVLGAVIVCLTNTFFVIATKLTSAGNAIALQFTLPVFIILFLWVFAKQRPSKQSIVTCLLIVGGITCFFFDDLTFASMLGNLCGLLSGLLYAMVFLFKKIEGMDFESSIVLSFAMSFVICIPDLLGEAHYALGDWTCTLLLGVFQMALAFILLGKGLNRVSPVAASIISAIEPVCNPILVAIFYHERLGALSLVGACVVIGASLWYNIRESRQPS